MNPLPISDATRGVILRFDRFEVLPDAAQLRKRGVLIHLSPQPFRILLLLVSRSGEIVTREEIRDNLWESGTFVAYEQGINAVIRRIRFALDDHAETPRFLETLPRVGYRFLAPIERIVPGDRPVAIESTAPPQPSPPAPPPANEPSREECSDSSPVQRSRRVRLIVALAALVTGLLTAHGPRSAPAAPERREKALVISVAPFRVGAGRPAIDAQSFDRELRRHLAEVQPRRIRVADPRSPADLRVDATLLSTKEGLRVDARILEGNSARQIWSDTFHRAPGDADDFPLEVALRVTRAVVARYVPPGRHEPFVRTAVSAPALELYRKGRAIRSQPEPQRDLDRALKLFEQALALEPRFAEAWSAIGDVWAERALLWRGQSQGASVSQARNALNRALALDPRNAEALNDLGLLLLQYDRSFAEAEPYLRSATVADPEYIDAHFNLSLLLTALGQTDGAVSAFRRAQRLDPESHYPSQFLAFVYLLGNRNDEAAVQYRAARLLLRRPESMDWALMWTAIGSRRWNDATRHLSGLLGRPVKIPAGVDDPATFFRKELRRFEQELLERERVGRIDPYSLACFYAEVGNADRAFAALNRAADVRSPNLIFTAVDPRLEPLRRDVRYYPILQRLGLRR